MAGTKTPERLVEYIRAAESAGLNVARARIEGRVIVLDFTKAVPQKSGDPLDDMDLRA